MATAKTVKLAVQVPGWAEWIAQDRDGSWRVFAGKPTQGANWWDQNGYRAEMIVLGCHRNLAWRTTLKRI